MKRDWQSTESGAWKTGSPFTQVLGQRNPLKPINSFELIGGFNNSFQYSERSEHWVGIKFDKKIYHSMPFSPHRLGA